MAPPTRANYRLGSVYALATAALLATQAPFSALAAKHFSVPQFLCLTQLSLLLSVPLLTLPPASRRDFAALLSNVRNVGKLAVLFVVGLCGLLLYNIGLNGAHPIVTAAILNLSPFWAAVVAVFVSRKSFPVSPLIFFGCFGVAFVGAMIVAWSQVGAPDQKLLGDVIKNLFHGQWAFAIPIPVFFALSGALVGRWFGEFDESAVIAANFVVAAVCLIPATLLIILSVRSGLGPHRAFDGQDLSAALLLIVGTLAASAAGRVYYQVALTATHQDNGFVTMFFLLIPVFSSLITVPLSWWIPDLQFVAGPLFFLGLVLITAPLFLFLLKSWRPRD
jgi:drug/metabolite transporter (DMT)-like permease